MSTATTSLLDCVPDPMVIVSADAVILSANKAFAALCGMTGEQAEGQAMWQAVGTPEAEWRDIVAHCCRTSGSLPFAAHFRNRSGALSRCRVQGTLLEHGPVKSSTIICLRVVPHLEATRGFHKLNEEVISLKREILARRAAEQSLRDSEERFRTMADNISQFAWMADATGSISWYNRRWYEYTGTTFEEMQGWGWGKVHHPEHVDRVVTKWRRSLASGEPWEDTFPLRGRDGTYHWFLSRALPIRDAEGRLYRWFGTNTDITELRDTQASLRLSEARYHNLIQALPAAVYTCDEKGRVTLYNQAAVALWGREPEIGKDLWCGSWKIYRPDGTVLPLSECPMARTLREGRAVRGEEILIERPDGTRRHVLPQPEPIKSADGAMVGAVNMLIDMTDFKRSEQALAHLAAIVTSSDDAIISMNLQGIVTSWNRAAERLYGYAVDEMIGQPVSRLIRPDRQYEESQILEQITRGASVEHYETIRRRKDGTELNISLTVSPVIDSQGTVIGASKIARDITQQKRAEEALQERDRALTVANETLRTQTAALAEANKELESFSYSVSHDLRAPLRTIDAFSRILTDDHGGLLDAEAHRCLGIVRKAAAQAGELIDDLLELSRLGRQSMHIRPVNMAALAHEAADDLRILQEGRTIDLMVGDLPVCQGDRRLLKLVWANVLGNAFKYTRCQGTARIEIGWLPDDAAQDSVTYYVKDNGIGFNMKYAHKLFGVFQRLHNKDEFEGTGVGLAIVQRIIQRHGGRVWAEGKVDGGATFFFSLRKGT